MAKENVYNVINNAFSPSLDRAFEEKFNIKVETAWNLFEMRKMTTRSDGKPFTQAQHDWIGAFSAGYCSAMNVAGTAR